MKCSCLYRAYLPSGLNLTAMTASVWPATTQAILLAEYMYESFMSEFHVRKENIVFIPNITEDWNHKRQLNWSGNETI